MSNEITSHACNTCIYTCTTSSADGCPTKQAHPQNDTARQQQSRSYPKRHSIICELREPSSSPDCHDLAKAQGECKRLEQEVLELRRDLEASLKDAKQSAEEANMANFQNQILIDMVRAALSLENVKKMFCISWI